MPSTILFRVSLFLYLLFWYVTFLHCIDSREIRASPRLDGCYSCILALGNTRRVRAVCLSPSRRAIQTDIQDRALGIDWLTHLRLSKSKTMLVIAPTARLSAYAPRVRSRSRLGIVHVGFDETWMTANRPFLVFLLNTQCRTQKQIWGYVNSIPRYKVIKVLYREVVNVLFAVWRWWAGVV